MYVVEGYTEGGSPCYLSDGAWIKSKYAGFNKESQYYHCYPINTFATIADAQQALLTADEISGYKIRELTQELIQQLS